MSGEFRVWLLQTPSPDAAEWRRAMADACATAGWDFSDQTGDAPPPVVRPERSMLVVASLHYIDTFPVTHYAVQHGSTDEVVETLSRDGRALRDVLNEASHWFAICDSLIQSGAPAAAMGDAELHLPGLGPVARPATAGAPGSTSSNPALALYRSLPVSACAEASWPQDLFTYTDRKEDEARSGALSLIGRRRLLFNGPNIFLPAGRWKFHAQFSVDPSPKADLQIEWGHGYDVQSLPVVITQPGRYEVEIEHAWTTANAADFRISLMTPALEGTFVFHGGVVTRLPDEPAQSTP